MYALPDAMTKTRPDAGYESEADSIPVGDDDDEEEETVVYPALYS